MIVLWVLALVSQDPQEQAVSGVKESAQASIADDFYQQGLRKLEAGDNAGAIDALSNALRARPNFPQAQRAEAQALFGLARQQEAAGNYGEANRLRTQARALDAGAPDQPAYGYAAPRGYVRTPGQMKPSRKDKWIGINLNGGFETLVGIGVSVFVLQHFEFVATLDTIKPAIDISGKAIFLKSNWSPYFGIGGHITLLHNVANPDFWNHNFLHVDAGMQYMHPSGFYMDLGLTWFPPSFDGGVSVFGSSLGDSNAYFAIPLPHLALGWAFEL